MAATKSDFHGVVIKYHPDITVCDYLKVLATLVELKNVKSFG